MPKARGSSAVGAARDKGAILSRERMAPLAPQGALPLDPAIARFGLEELLSLWNRVSAVFLLRYNLACSYYPLPLCPSCRSTA